MIREFVANTFDAHLSLTPPPSPPPKKKKKIVCQAVLHTNAINARMKKMQPSTLRGKKGRRLLISHVYIYMYD